MIEPKERRTRETSSAKYLRNEQEIDDKRQIPFRYRLKLEPDLQQLFKLQHGTKKINEALTIAVKLSSALIKKVDPGDLDPWTKGSKLKELLAKELKIPRHEL